MKQPEKNPHIQTVNPKEHATMVFAGCGDCCKCCDGMYTCANVLVDEMFDTAKLFPVVFSKKEGEDGEISLTLLYTLQKGVPCPYLDKESGWCKVYDSVRPRACKVYPFNVHEVRSAGQGRSFAVVFDDRCPGMRESDDGEPLIDEGGKFSDALRRKFFGDDMLRNYRENLLKTRDFLQLVHKLQLLSEEEIPVGGMSPVADYFGEGRPNTMKLWKISETKLAALTPEQVMEIYNGGFFNAIYTHLNSLKNMDRLIQTRDAHVGPRVDFLSFQV